MSRALGSSSRGRCRATPAQAPVSVRGRERWNVLLVAISGHQIVARDTRAGLQSAAPLAAPFPGQDRMRETKRGRYAAHHFRLMARFGAKPVIDAEHVKFWP